MTENPGIATFRTVVLDAPAPPLEAAFWAVLTGSPITEQDADWFEISTSDGWDIAFQLAPELIAPQWPSSDSPQQLHIDLRVPDLAAATTGAVEQGARLLRENEKWNTLADPAGHPFDLVAASDVLAPTVWGVTFDVPDAAAAASFWSAVLGAPIAYEGEEGSMLGGPRPVLFQKVDRYTPPAWPDPAHPQQGHLDLTVADLDAGEAAALAIGAVRLPGGGAGFRVFADPAGHPFCLCQ